MSAGLNSSEIVPGHMASPARYSFVRVVRPLIERFLTEEGRIILDFGCGTGVWRFLFDVEKTYVGFDAADAQFAEKVDRNTRFLLADGRFTPFRDESFDFVFCNAVFEHIEEDYRAASESFRVLKRGKYCCVIVPTSLSPIYDEWPFLPARLVGRREGHHGEHYYSRRHIVELLEASGYEIEYLTFSLGFWGLVLKTLYVYSRIPRWYGTRFVNKLLTRTYRFNLVGDSRAWQARSRVELQRICEEEGKNLSIGHKMYRRLLEIAVVLDQRIPIPIGGEWCVLAKKP